MPFLTKHLSHTVATALAVWHLICKNGTNFFFLLHNFTEDSFLTKISVTSAYYYFFFLSLLSQELSHFHLKKAHYGFSLAYLNWQHHYFCSLQQLLSKINVTWTQALRYCDSQSDNRGNHQVTNRWDTWDKVMIHVPGRTQVGQCEILSYYSE